MHPRIHIFTEQAKIFKALGHPSRLIIVDALRQGEQCVCALQALIGHDMSTVSKHLSVLKEAGIVKNEKRGTSIYYHLELSCLDTFLSCSEEAVHQRLKTQLDTIKE